MQTAQFDESNFKVFLIFVILQFCQNTSSCIFCFYFSLPGLKCLESGNACICLSNFIKYYSFRYFLSSFFKYNLLRFSKSAFSFLFHIVCVCICVCVCKYIFSIEFWVSSSFLTTRSFSFLWFCLICSLAYPCIFSFLSPFPDF